MAISLQLQGVYADGSATTTVDLSDGTTTIVTAYTPLQPTDSDVSFDPGPLGDGGELLATGYRNVSEPVTVLVMGASAAAVRNTIHAIENALEQARRYANKKQFPRMYARFVPESVALGGTLLRSEILKGKLTFDPTTVDQWNRYKTYVQITWTRRFYWETTTDVQLGLTNVHGTNTLFAIQVDAANDATNTRNNYVVVPSGTVLGTTPAPLRLEFTHNTNDSTNIGNVYVGGQGYGDGTSFVGPDLEGELANGITQLPATANTSLYSSGKYGQAGYAADSVEHLCFEWNLTQTLLNATRGNMYRIMVRFVPTLLPTGNEYVRFYLYYQGTTVLWSGPTQKLSAGQSIVDCGAVPLPPWLVGLNSQQPMTLRMVSTVYTGSGTQFLNIDVVHLLPTYSWRKYTPRGYGLPYAALLIDDAINGYVYQDNLPGSTGRAGYYNTTGAPLMIDPNASNQFFFVWDEITGGSSATRSATVKLFYRPRYLSV